jgi:two-component system, OmpR family, sensor histidine kinase KdpD
VISGGLRARITLAVLVAALLPAAVFGLLLVVSGNAGSLTLVLTGLVIAAIVGLAVGGLLVGLVTGPLRVLATRLDRITAGERPGPLPLLTDDELGRLAERQEELAADLDRRNRQVARAVAAITAWTPGDGAVRLLEQAALDARDGLGLNDARIVLGDRLAVEFEERVPGEPRPVRADVRTGPEIAGVLAGHAPATTRWEPADQDLLELFAASLALALRDADLLARVEAQNERLRALDAEKDDFLRGVSHNLQTPLARIRANADQLAGEQAAAGDADRRLAIITEQSDRLSRMVRQLLTVSRLDSGVLHPMAEVSALGPRVRRAWEALGAGSVQFELVDEAGGWLTVADPDHVDQVIWALLDNAVRHGRGAPVTAHLGVDPAAGRVSLTIADGGPGVAEADRERLFARYARGGASDDRDGTGLGLYVSRELARANGGDLVLDPEGRKVGDQVARFGQPRSSFTLTLPAESPTES